LQEYATKHYFRKHKENKQALSLLVGGPEDHLQQLANSASVTAIHASLLSAMEELEKSNNSSLPPAWIRLQCTVSSIQVLREYAQRMGETFKGFLSQQAMISIGGNSGGLANATKQALRLVSRFQPDSLLSMNEDALLDWHHKVIVRRNSNEDVEQQQPQHLLMAEENGSWGGVDSVSMWINLFSVLLYTVNYYIVAPTANRYARLLGVDGAFGATLVGASSLAAIFAAFLYSFWITKGSFKSALLCSAACPCVGNILYALAISYSSMPMALMGRFLVGFGSAEVVNRQLISACVAFRYMTAASAIFVASSAIGMSVGPLMAAILDMSSGRDTAVDIPIAFLPKGGIIFDHVTSPGFYMAAFWLIEMVALLIFFREPDRVNGGEKEEAFTDDKQVPIKRSTSGHFRHISCDFDLSEYISAKLESQGPSNGSYQNGETEPLTASNRSSYSIKPKRRSSGGVWSELVTVKNLIFGNIALPITMLIFGYIELVCEVLIRYATLVMSSS